MATRHRRSSLTNWRWRPAGSGPRGWLGGLYASSDGHGMECAKVTSGTGARGLAHRRSMRKVSIGAMSWSGLEAKALKPWWR